MIETSIPSSKKINFRLLIFSGIFVVAIFLLFEVFSYWRSDVNQFQKATEEKIPETTPEAVESFESGESGFVIEPPQEVEHLGRPVKLLEFSEEEIKISYQSSGEEIVQTLSLDENYKISIGADKAEETVDLNNLDSLVELTADQNNPNVIKKILIL